MIKNRKLWIPAVLCVLVIAAVVFIVLANRPKNPIENPNAKKTTENGVVASAQEVQKPQKPTAPVLRADKKAYTTDENIRFDWGSVTGAAQYQIFIYCDNELAVTDRIDAPKTGYSSKLKAGAYRAYIDAANEAGSISSNAIAFTVSAPDTCVIRYDMALYKQMDARWKDYKLGINEKFTMGKIGCLVVSLAMTESFRTAKTIYPDAMAKELTFSRGGGLTTWPKHYVLSRQVSLNAIFNILKNKKVPVILCGLDAGKTKTHWVVVTGCSVPIEKDGKPKRLSAEMFTIHDPSPANRVTLDQFIKTYPNITKIRYRSK